MIEFRRDARSRLTTRWSEPRAKRAIEMVEPCGAAPLEAVTWRPQRFISPRVVATLNTTNNQETMQA